MRPRNKIYDGIRITRCLEREVTIKQRKEDIANIKLIAKFHLGQEMENCSKTRHIWPQSGGYNQVLEHVLRREMELGKDLEHKSDEEQLEVSILEKRRLGEIS
ncbi:hypothetical protein DUI87_24849 [Hirundo rustica rustica]|uniref:Uncharacterized protein n=1 Tax=Hirundo rustica rustica TaxID=333673 RepID=A0A3M0JCF5_HIRRU|nr:hypothetical protein DUI87_24849 [Hirundo rustica rustica]